MIRGFFCQKERFGGNNMMISITTKDRLRDRPDEERKVVFLDIDGVLQPPTAQERFNHDMDALKEELAEKYHDEHFLELDKYDVAAVYYDWSESALRHLRNLLSYCDAEIVLSSDWRFSKTIEDMRTLLKIHCLNEYLTELLPQTNEYSGKDEDITAYLSKHPKLTRYVVVDDSNLGKFFRGKFVLCNNVLGNNEYNQICRILNYRSWWDDLYHKVYMYHDLKETIEDNFSKVIFLDIDGVLNDDGERRENGEIICEEYVRNLKEIVQNTNAEIILSSSWRYGMVNKTNSSFIEKDKGLSILFDLFDKYHLYIAGMTPIICNGPDGRPLEIRTWLSRRPDITKFVILDDEDFWNWGWMKPFVVITSYVRETDNQCLKRISGLNSRFSYQAIKILED